MNTFYAADGQFWLNDKPQLIQAAELHYFRTPPDQWRHRLGLLQAAGFNTLATYIPWRWHQLAEGVSDFDGHSHPMRNLAGFLDLARDMGLLIIARPGPYIMAETTNEGIPDWVFTNYPQTAFVDQHSSPHNVVSYLHPDFLASVAQWYRAIFTVLTPRQITRDGAIIMIQLDNEMGMIQWVRNIVDLNPDTLARFAAYVRQTYGEQAAQRYPAADLTACLKDGLALPDAPQAAQVMEDYRPFYRQYLREYTTFMLAEAVAQGLEVPPVINIHGFMNGGKTFPIGLSQLVEVMRLPGMLSATDVYPGFIGEGNFHQLLLVNETTKALQNRQQPLFSIEFQAGGNNDFMGGQTSLFDLHTRLCLSTGMRAINHYLFHDGDNHPVLSPTRRHDWGHPVRADGTLRRHYARYGKLASVLAVYGEALVRARPQTATTVGFLLDYFMTEVHNPATKAAALAITHQREEIMFDMLGKGLALTHRPFDAVELASGRLDPAQTPVLWVQLARQCNADTQQKLVDYVRQGGKLVLIGQLCAEAFDHTPCTLLQAALGVTPLTTGAPQAYRPINAFAALDVPATGVETYSGAFAEVIATSVEGETVGFIQNVGAGRVLMFGATVPANTLEDLDLVEQMARKMDCPALFTLSDWVDIRISRGEGGSFLFLNNYQDDPVTTTVDHAGAALFSGHPVTVPARQGLILPLEWQLNAAVTVNFATSEIIAVEEAGDTLTLKLRQAEGFAELTLAGWRCAAAATLTETATARRVAVHTQDGAIVLQRAG